MIDSTPAYICFQDSSQLEQDVSGPEQDGAPSLRLMLLAVVQPQLIMVSLIKDHLPQKRILYNLAMLKTQTMLIS